MTGGRLHQALLAGLLMALAICPALAQPLDLSHGGPITVTASDGIEWRQNDQVVIARGNARAVRGDVTVVADRLLAYYRKKPGATGATSGQASEASVNTAPASTVPANPAAANPAAASTAAASAVAPGTPAQPAAPGGLTPGDADTSGNEIYRVEAEGNVHVFTPTDHAEADRGVYDLDQAVLLMTGRHLRLTTPNDVLTARDDMEYWAQKHMAVARGDAVVVTKDGRRLAGDTLVAYTTEGQPNAGASSGTAKGAHVANGAMPPQATRASVQSPPAKPPDDPIAASGKLQKVDAFGNVSVRTATETVTGDRAVYVPDTGIARLGGNVRITRGQNQLNGAEAEVNLKTGISRLISGNAGRVQGLVVPNDAQAAAQGGTGQGGTAQGGMAQGGAAPGSEGKKNAPAKGPKP